MMRTLTTHRGSFLALCLLAAAVTGGIPEPDVVILGTVCLDGAPQQGPDTNVFATVRPPDGVERVVGGYRLGDNSLAAGLYVLRIRRESGVDGSLQGQNAARENQVVRVYVQRGSNTPTEATSFMLDEAGTIRWLDLAVGTNRGIDGDFDNDLADFAKLQSCFSGPNGTLTADCASADLDGDDDVDGDDFRVLSTTGAGPC